ncbi:hypothetical protein HDV05_003113 [Chytridiales sp. JEL 0842]|nr:hypothetical protein HDV05_003113 [Chytridiales sp. JEL 0842]
MDWLLWPTVPATSATQQPPSKRAPVDPGSTYTPAYIKTVHTKLQSLLSAPSLNSPPRPSSTSTSSKSSTIPRASKTTTDPALSPSRNSTTSSNALSAQRRSEIESTLKTLADALVWSDNQSRTDLFDAFFEKNTHHLILDLSKEGDEEILISLLKFFNVVLESISQPSVLFFLFSNNYINDVILLPSTTTNSAEKAGSAESLYSVDGGSGAWGDEVLSYYVTLLKNLSSKLNGKTIQLLFHQHLNDFPLFTEAVRYYRHEERMVRIAVNHQHTTDFLIKKRKFLYTIVRNFIEEVQVLISHLVSSGDARFKAEEQVDEILDQILYMQDIFLLSIPALSRTLGETLNECISSSVLIESLKSKVGSEGAKMVSLFVLTQLVVNIGYAPVVNALVELLFRKEMVEPRKSVSTHHGGGVVKMGAVRAGSGGLFGEDVEGVFGRMGLGEGEGGVMGGLSKRASVVMKAPSEVTPNPLRESILSLLSTDPDTGKPMHSEVLTSLALGLLFAVLNSTLVSADTLKDANLYPRRSRKSKILMDSLTSTNTNDAAESAPGKELSYDAALVSDLIGLVSYQSACLLRPITLELVFRVLGELTITGGSKAERLEGVHMDSFKSALAILEIHLMDLVKAENEILTDVLDFELQQAGSNLERAVGDMRLLLPTEEKEEEGEEGRVGFLVRCWKMMYDTLSHLGWRRDGSIPCNPLRADFEALVGASIDLNPRMLAACILSEPSKTLNSYYVFDQENAIFIEVDRLRLGKGKIYKCFPILDTYIEPVPETPNAAIVRHSHLEFVSDSKRKSLSFAAKGGYRVCETVQGWEAQIIFTSGSGARGYVVTHVEEGRKHRREGRREAVGKWLGKGFGE